jgi:hypothetical protein
VDLREVGYKVLGKWNWLRSSPMAGFGIRDLEPPGSATTDLLKF